MQPDPTRPTPDATTGPALAPDDLDAASAAHLAMLVESMRLLRTPRPDPGPAFEWHEPWPVVGSRGVDEDLAHAILHAARALPLSLQATDFGVTAAVIGTDSALKRFSPRSGAAAAALDASAPRTTLVEHLRLAIEACDRYLARHPGTPEVELVRHDLFRARVKATP